MFIVAAAFKQQFFTHVGGHFFSPELPKLVIEGLHRRLRRARRAIRADALPRPVARAARSIARAANAWRTGSGMYYGVFSSSGISPATAALMLALSLSVGVYGVYEAQRQPRIVEREAVFAELPPEFDGYRIIHLSDLHISASRKAPWAVELVRRACELNPDLILITGDFIDGTVEARRGDVEPLRGAARARRSFRRCGQPRILFRLARMDGAV